MVQLQARGLHQLRNEVRWRPGQETSLTPLMFEPEVFRRQI